MKKALLLSLVIGMMAASANAATLRMNFAGGGDVITVAPTDEFTVEVWIDMVAGETLAGAFYPNGFAAGLVQVGLASPPTNWARAGYDSVLGDGNQQASFGALNPSMDSLVGPGSVLIGLQYIHQNDLTGDYEIVFGDPLGGFVGLLDQSAVSFIWYGYGGSFAGYYEYGKGSPYVPASGRGGAIPGQAADPLIVHCIPEPAALSLLLLGGVAVLRRR